MIQRNLKSNPLLVISDGRGNIFEIPGLEMVCRRIGEIIVANPEELIPMPHGSILMELPGRYPVGFNRKQNKIIVLKRYRGHPVLATAVFLAPAHTQLYFAAYHIKPGAVKLPLFAYTPVGWRNGSFWVPAIRVDKDIRHDVRYFKPDRVDKAAHEMLKKFPHNRLVEHLVTNCVTRYNCPNAQNFVLGRWECPVPMSPTCNARCMGCISKQPGEVVSPTQHRITFIPHVAEILEFAIPHLENAPRSIISFGQGCEGEPLLQGSLLEETIRKIKSVTSKGTINLNTNACDPDVIEKLCRAGLDSSRVSLNSAQPNLYNKYYKPTDYTFEDVLESISIMRKYGRWISLNYFIFPGLTDDPNEIEHLLKIVIDQRVDYIQMRNLNIDPDWYIHELGLKRSTSWVIGILRWQETIKVKAPWVGFGYFNPPKEDWSKLKRYGGEKR